MAFKHFTSPSKTNLVKVKPQKRGRLSNSKSQSISQFWDLALLFGKRTTIHGLNHLFGEREGCFERAVWFLIVVLAFIGSNYVCFILSRRFNEGKFQTVVDSTRLPVYRIPFPATTICSWNALNWDRLPEAKRIFMPNETSLEKLELFEEVVAVYDSFAFGQFDKFGVLEGKPLETLNHVNFSLVYEFMTWRCEEFLDNCEWRYRKVNCCEIFSKRRSKYGLCWAFNTLENEEGQRKRILDPMWPWRTGSAGPGSGLKVRVFINPEKHNPKSTNDKGLSIMTTEPYVWHKDALNVPANTNTFIEITPVIYSYSNDTRIISSDQRECVFEDERSSSDFKSLLNYKYMIENCQAECQQEYLMHFCNCSVDLFFPPGQFPPCKAKDLLCLARYNDNFLYLHQPGEDKYVKNYLDGMICKCYRNCFSCNYTPEARIQPLKKKNRINATHVDLDVFFLFETLMVYRTSLVFGWIDLLVSFGGIAGLFLGCSLISAIELIYFACIDLPNFVLNRVKSLQNSTHHSDDKVIQVESSWNYGKFRGLKKNNKKYDSKQFEKYVMKNYAIQTIVDESRLEDFKVGRSDAEPEKYKTTKNKTYYIH